MKKRWLLRLGLLAGLGLFIFGFYLWWTAPKHRINQRSMELIQKGMTLDDAVAILGVPPGDYTTASLSNEGDEERYSMQWEPGRTGVEAVRVRWEYWFCDTCGIGIRLDDDRRVTETKFSAFPTSFMDKLRGLLAIR